MPGDCNGFQRDEQFVDLAMPANAPPSKTARLKNTPYERVALVLLLRLLPVASHRRNPEALSALGATLIHLESNSDRSMKHDIFLLLQRQVHQGQPHFVPRSATATAPLAHKPTQFQQAPGDEAVSHDERAAKSLPVEW